MITIKLWGGLGNQMFQFAFGKSLEALGKEVDYDVSFFNQHKNCQYSLEIFPHISVKLSEKQDASLKEKQYLNRGIAEKIKNKLFPQTNLVLYEDSAYFNRTDLSKLENTLIVGYFQNERYFKHMRDQLLQDFSFGRVNSETQNLANQIQGETAAVSIHFRRGDYLVHNKIYGGICTKEYYNKAIEFIKEQMQNPHFYIFSNDIAWVQKNFKIPNAVYVNDDLCANRMDWYDLYLMSICKHNIVANSTFSWWAAWLNQNSHKIVISPNRLDNVSRKCIASEGWVIL